MDSGPVSGRRTGYVWHELYGWHFGGMTPYERPTTHLRFVQPIPHVESPESKRRIHSLLEVSGILKSLIRLDPAPATEESVLRFHTKEYIDRIQQMSLRDGGEAGECAPFSPGGWNIALLSAGGVIKAVDSVLDGTVDNAYCLVRPPGHHAERDRGRGFCLLGNVAIAAFHALEVRGGCNRFYVRFLALCVNSQVLTTEHPRYRLCSRILIVAAGIQRISIIDWDVHHGIDAHQILAHPQTPCDRSHFRLVGGGGGKNEKRAGRCAQAE